MPKQPRSATCILSIRLPADIRLFFIDLVLPAAATDGRFNPTGRSVDSSHDFGANEMFCVAWFE